MRLRLAAGPRAARIGAQLRQHRISVPAERALPVAVATLLAGASLISFLPASPSGPVGGPDGRGSDVRLAVGGAPLAPGPVGPDGPGGGGIDAGPGVAGAGLLEASFEPIFLPEEAAGGQVQLENEVTGPFLADGTLLTGVAPNTSVEDGSGFLQTYKVEAGDTLTGIARKFGVSMMTLWWANKLTSKDELHIGQVLTIPPVSGLVVTVGEADTLESLAARHGVDPIEIIEVNALDDPTLVVGQTLILPGALGAAIPTPKPTPRPVVGRSSGGGTTVRPPVRYSGGAFAWPVVGGNNYLSQYYRYGHYGIDIAATSGSRVRSVASGRVVFSGWKSNGGGYQVWVAHGGGLYTGYYHMSGVSVGTGQSVSRGQQVGRIGCTGWCSGPHLHFEVWRGPIWDGGTRVNPLRYF